MNGMGDTGAGSHILFFFSIKGVWVLVYISIVWLHGNGVGQRDRHRMNKIS
jgi:hypothetical protein